MMRHWTLKPLCFGVFTAFEMSLFTYGRNAGQKIAAPITGWLIESGETRILVDTGPSSPASASRWHYTFQQASEQDPQAALRALGVRPDDLPLVILTHLHWDHCYNLDRFPTARFFVQAEELRAAVDPIPTQRIGYEVGIRGLVPPWVAGFDRMELVRGDREVAPGVRVIHLPGHTPGLQGVLVDTAMGRHLIASDAVPLYENLGTPGAAPAPPGIHVDVAACFRSFERIREEADVILPSHDPEVLRHPIYPVH
jgi:N-acyl homoserine lactone hydrolase